MIHTNAFSVCERMDIKSKLRISLMLMFTLYEKMGGKEEMEEKKTDVMWQQER